MSDAADVVAVVVAAGRGKRYGGAKQFEVIDGVTVAAHSVRAARSVAGRVVLVVPADYRGDGEGADVVVTGGETRAASVRAGLSECAAAEVVVVHDAARPRATNELFAAVVAAVRDGADGAVPALALIDTLKRVSVSGGRDVVATEDRGAFVTVQTPQAFRRDVLTRAHAGGGEASDDAALVEALGARVVTVPGQAANVKLTEPGDLGRVDPTRVDSTVAAPWRVGQGIDLHRVSDDPDRALWLALVRVPAGPGLVGHSDADVATHALCDALLGAANLGDLGRHFPDTDPQWRGVSSRHLLVHTLERVREAGFAVTSGDLTIIADRPRLGPYLDEMSRALSEVVGVAVSVKATSAEGLGSIGRVEGIGASAVAVVRAR